MYHPDGPSFRELLVQAMSSTERGYDLIAPKFDRTPFRTPHELLELVAPYIGECRAAVDFCCGTGAGLRMLRPLVSERVVGVDFSQGMLDEARRRLQDAPGTAAVELRRGDVLAMPFEPEFDVAVSFGAFGHFLHRDHPQLVRQIARSLVRGGRFVFVTRDPPPLLSRTTVVYRGFNAVMHVRNALWKPAFVMYYLNFLLPHARVLLEEEGFDVAVHDPGLPGVWAPFRIVVATKR